MGGTIVGGRKAAKTNIKKYGEDFYSRIGREGGKKGTTGGFAAMPREKVQAAGRKGGANSSRCGVKNGEGKARREEKKFRWPWSK